VTPGRIEGPRGAAALLKINPHKKTKKARLLGEAGLLRRDAFAG
jgi:hypothetical protein